MAFSEQGIGKWNFKTREYEPYTIPQGWYCPLLISFHPLHQEESLKVKVNCADCGKEVIYGNTYTSRTIHNTLGIGYPICNVCYKEELKDAGL